MGPRPEFGSPGDLRDRCAVAPLRPVLGAPGHEDGALVPDGGWMPPRPPPRT
ncbi:hypothetical protein AB0O01_26895 [Streptomyces sp. NPDC093252]|uniref:hypothetical protein n=1 Tax=Streptomyces sp. NPDC093252 TaxID=3154980 RepID=UPI00342E93C9